MASFKISREFFAKAKADYADVRRLRRLRRLAVELGA